ncbi:MAG: LysE family translocator [Elusimicrobia bacterium]|nr:LysE family translocator [Elusimicrobiota bacterium]
MALVTRNAVAYGRAAALRTALGIEAGLLVWTAASAVGLAALLETSALAYSVVKVAGAAYLVYLGTELLIGILRSRSATAHQPSAAPLGSSFRQGLLSNLLNPKIAVLFTSLIPQFVTPGPMAAFEAVSFALIFAGLGFVWLVSFALFTSAAGRALRAPVVRRALDAITGTVLIGLGLRLATERSEL